MTDRYNYVLVTLENDVRDDDAEPILTALRMVKGVADVTPHVSDMRDLLAEEAARCRANVAFLGKLKELWKELDGQ